MRDETYEKVIEALAKTYGPRALALLKRIGEVCDEAGFVVEPEPGDLSHNERMMEEAGVPRGGHSPRRGFHTATSSNQDYITEIERRDHEKYNGKTISFWIVNTSFYSPDEPRPGRSVLDHGWIIGPRGKVTKSW